MSEHETEQQRVLTNTAVMAAGTIAVSYTHLTLPTN